MKEKWLTYLSNTKDENLVPFMEDYFNDKISFNKLNEEVEDLGLMRFEIFKKEEALNELLGD